MQKQHNQKLRIVSFLLAFLLAFTGVPMERLHAEGEEAAQAEGAALLARYPLAQDVNDISGNGKNGEAHGSVTYNEGLTLPGGKKTSAGDASYVTLPGDIFAGKENLTISVWIKSATDKGNYAALFFGTPPQSNNMPLNYWLFNPTNPGGLFKSVFTDSNNSNAPYQSEKGVTAGGTEVYKGKWVHYTTVLTENSVTGYINGQKVGQASKSKKVADFGTDIQAYIGRSNYLEDNTYAASFQDLQVYGGAMDDAQVQELYFDTTHINQAAQETLLPQIADQLSLEGQAENGVLMEAKKLELPSRLHGASIQWASDNTAVIANDGQVTLPAQQAVVTLTATLALGSQTAEKAFTLTVLPAGGSLSYVADHLQIPYTLDPSVVLPTKSGDVSISWSGSNAISANGAVAPDFDGKQAVTLKAVLTAGGQTAEKSFQCILFGKDTSYVQTYTRDPSGDMVNKLARSMFLAYSENGKDNFTALHDDYGILFMRAESADNGVLTPKGMKDPYLFYTKDGKYGVVAVRTAENGSDDPTKKSSVMFYVSEDLVDYDEVGFIDLNTTASVNEPVCEYDSNADAYKIVWNDGAGNYYQNTISDIQAGSAASNPENTIPVSIRRAEIGLSGTHPGNLFPLEGAKGTKLKNKLTKLINTGMEAPASVIARRAQDVENVRATALYNDGSTASKKVAWDLSNVKFDAPGKYTVNGTVTQPTFNNSNALFNARPDPEMAKYNGKFYFISTDESGQGRIYIRESDTLEGIKNSSETLLLDGNSYPNLFKACLWAPELHVIEGRLYVFFAGSMTNWAGVQSHVMRLKEGGDPKKTSDWETPIRVKDKDGNNLYDADTQGITLDMTYFEAGGKSYVCWAQRQRHPVDNGSWLYIATVDKNEPWKLTSDRVCICKPDYGWDNNNTFVVEGPFALQRDGNIFLTFSGGATDHTYCVGIMKAKEGSDLLDAASWRKGNYPILTSWSVPNQYGPGHNAYIQDDDGVIYNTYHAKWNRGTRSASIRRVHFDIDGDPVLDLVEERDLLDQYKAVTMKVIVPGSDFDAKKELQDLYGKYAAITERPAQTTAEDWKAFTEAVAKAKDLLAQANPAESDLLAAANGLRAAADRLVLIESLEITPPSKKEYEVGEALDLTGLKVTAIDSKGVKHALREGDYTVGPFDSATVGTKTITITYEGQTASFDVTVAQRVVEVQKVTVSPAALTLAPGKSQALTASITPSNATDKTLSWKSDNTKAAKVDQSGKVTAVKAGTATITVKAANGASASCKVTVKAPTVAVKKVKLGKTKLTLGVKEKFTLKATVSPSNATSKKVTWKSDKKSVATVSSKGVVTAKKAGTAKITATAGGKKATCKITVKKAPSKITLDKKKTIKKGKTYQLKVKLPKNTASNKITFSTSNKKVATVSSAGKVKGLKKGTAVITAKTFNGKKAKITITVK